MAAFVKVTPLLQSRQLQVRQSTQATLQALQRLSLGEYHRGCKYNAIFKWQCNGHRLCSKSSDSTYITTYQRDMGATEASRGCNDDNVGKRKHLRGKRMFHKPQISCNVGRSASFGSPLPDHTHPTNQSASACAGHLPGYTGHIPRTTHHEFVPGGNVRSRNHQKDFYLLPVNYRTHVAGYTGNVRSAVEAYKNNFPFSK